LTTIGAMSSEKQITRTSRRNVPRQILLEDMLPTETGSKFDDDEFRP